MDTLQGLGLKYPCSYCGAQPGEFCVTVKPYTDRPAGQRVPWNHQARQRPIEDGWVLGGRDARRYVARAVLQNREGGEQPDPAWLELALQRWAKGEW